MDAVTVINRALARIGCLPIQSTASPGPAGIGVVNTYSSILDDLLSKYPWSFTKKFAGLVKSTDAPIVNWTYRFVLPPDRIALPRAYYDSATSRRPLTRFEIEAKHVLCNSSTLFCAYQFRPDPNSWPGYFSELMVLCLSAEYALEVREDPTLRDTIRKDAYGHPQYQGEGGQFKVASDLDAQAQPSEQPDGGRNPLVDARYEEAGSWDPEDARYGW